MDGPLDKNLTNLTIANTYKLVKKLGAGAFGEIYQAINKQNKQEFAIKLEQSSTKFPQIFFEAKLYNYLQNGEDSDKGIPRVYGSSTEGPYNYMVMDLLGRSLEDLINNRKFSLKTVLMLADQMITRIEFIHSRSFIHRDIKPDNFLMGSGNKSHRVYVVDFGLAKRYQTKDGHIPYRENKSLTGTARYASINTHIGVEQSRRDDLESLAYVFFYFLKGQLPWQNLKQEPGKDKYQLILEKKQSTPAELICKGLPIEFASFLNYSKGLKFEEKPDYHYLRGLFKEVFRKNNFDLDYRYDWIRTNEKVAMEAPIDSKPQPPLPQRQVAASVGRQVKQQDQPAKQKQVDKQVEQQPEKQIQDKPQQQQIQQQKQPEVIKQQTQAQLQQQKIHPQQKQQQLVQQKQIPTQIPKPRNVQTQYDKKRIQSGRPSTEAQKVTAPRIVINKEPYTKV